MINQRSSGFLLHITSLPSSYGIGDLGPEAYKFADFVANSGSECWQVLPLNPVSSDYGFSPYSGLSAFAGNTLLISPDMMHEEGLLDQEDLKNYKLPPSSKVNFQQAIENKVRLLEKAWRKFEYNLGFNDPKFLEFWDKHDLWLEDYALFIALSEKYDTYDWKTWPEEIKEKKQKPIETLQQELEGRILKEKFLQYVFFRQWDSLKKYCHQSGIKLFGDLPFYVSSNSADVWSFPQFFKLDSHMKPTASSGVPPDYFSETGQLWNTPVFNWKQLKKENFFWWTQRILHNFKFFDLLRLDHFRAFSAYWEVPAYEETATNGKWRKTPGNKFFKLLKEKDIIDSIIAEDLGDIDNNVVKLMEKYRFPGMNVLHFGFEEKEIENEHIPYNHLKNSVVYTGTHDNNTSKGWFENDASEEEKIKLCQYTGKKITQINVSSEMIRLAMESTANLAMVPIQDVLDLGQEAMMNRPGTESGNWQWRLLPNQLTEQHAKMIKGMNETFGRNNKKE